MIVANKDKIDSLNKIFVQKCIEIIEKGIEAGDFRMKDVAAYLGISSQVASKIVNPSSPRGLTAFELFRMSALCRTSISELIPLELYLTEEELKDNGLCQALLSIPSDNSDTGVLIAYYRRLPSAAKHIVLMLVRFLTTAKWE